MPRYTGRPCRSPFLIIHAVRRLAIDFNKPDTHKQLSATRLIFGEYAAQRGVDLCLQNFDDELASLPGKYVQPQGALLLALVNGQVAGCCALRPLTSVDYSKRRGNEAPVRAQAISTAGAGSPAGGGYAGRSAHGRLPQGAA